MFSNIYFDRYKSFAANDEPNKLPDLKRVNVFIGKNNSGKSSILDVIGSVYDLDFHVGMGDKLPTIDIGAAITKEHIDSAFSGRRHFSYSSSTAFISAHGDSLPFVTSIGYEKSLSYTPYHRTLQDKVPTTWNIQDSELQKSLLRNFCQKIDTFLQKSVFKRLSAERNITPEQANTSELLDAHGVGATSLIERFLNHNPLPEKVIEADLLDALNKIMYPDAVFKSIRIQTIERNDEQLWEVFLQEEGYERFALSQSGSGLKTIILVLLNLLAIPLTDKYEGKQIVYGFEELENNLHPYLQRRLFEYIYEYAMANDIHVFLTTHSHVAINTFFGKENTSLYHVTKENGVSSVTQIANYVDKVKILDDLDVKASDMLQANGVIWVEGPSDKIYIKRWLEVFFGTKYREGEHYQFLPYGGKLLAHYDCSDEDTEQFINLLTLNRNAAIVIDRDKDDESDSLNSTKERVIAAFEKFNMFSWVTSGKEVENYISFTAIRNALGCNISKQCGQYRKFPDYIKRHQPNFSSNKVPFARKIVDFITAENSKDILDLKQQIEKLYSQIETWNE